MVPGLRACGEDILRRTEQRRIVQTGGLDAEDGRNPGQCGKQRAAACRAETTFDSMAAVADRSVKAWLSVDDHRCLRKHRDRCVAAAARALAIAAVTVQHYSRIGISLVANRTAGATAGKLGHVSPLCFTRCPLLSLARLIDEPVGIGLRQINIRLRHVGRGLAEHSEHRLGPLRVHVPGL